MERRSLLIASAATVLTGCARGLYVGPSYTETITALAATPDWKQIVVFGDKYDYEFAPTAAFVEQLNGPFQARIAADFHNARLGPDNTVTLEVRFSMRETDMTPEELRKYWQKAPELPGRRVLGAHYLRLHRVQKTPNPERFGVKPTNNRYEIPVNGYAETPTPPKSRIFSELGDMVGMVILLPIVLIFLAVKH